MNPDRSHGCNSKIAGAVYKIVIPFMLFIDALHGNMSQMELVRHNVARAYPWWTTYDQRCETKAALGQHLLPSGPRPAVNDPRVGYLICR